jgi:two-component system KDP operon response regulator KdpE
MRETPRPLILAVDDEPDILRVLELALTDDGFDVVPVSRAADVVPLVRDRRPALVLLDIVLPEKSGLEVLDEIRAFSPVPVILLTARGSNRDIVAGLERGADDYVSKPFNLGELAARVRAVLRRAGPEAVALGVAEFGRLRVDFLRRLVTVDGRPVHLTRNEWRLLEQFVRSPGRVISHEELLTRAWGPEFAADVDYLRVWLSRLRRKLTEAGLEDNLIRTASGMGYAFGLEQMAGREPSAP